MTRFRRLRVHVKKVGAKLKPARRAISGARSRISRGARKKMRKMGIGRARSLLILPALLLLILFTAWLGSAGVQKVQFTPLPDSPANPLMGVAASARDDLAYAPQDTQLVWAVATWRELEPQEGVYAFDAFDEEIHLDKWRERGAKLIFRLSMDSAENDFVCDVPDWLAEKTGGTAYEADGQERFAPDWANPILQDAHFRLLQAIEERYGADIAYVEIGSLGHDGAWRGPQMPMMDVTSVYIWQYFTAFPQRVLLAAGPYHEAMLSGGGVYLDDLADGSHAWEWVNRLRFGGWDNETGVLLRPAENFGLHAPSGAWLADEGDTYILANMAREARLTYICADHSAMDDIRQMKNAVGYRYWVRQAQWPEKVRRDYSLYVDICMANAGCAPMQRDWPLCLAFLDENGNVVHSEAAEADVRKWLPGDTELRVRITVPYDTDKGEYTLALAVCEPDTLEPAVRFAMECETIGLWHVLGEVEIY